MERKTPELSCWPEPLRTKPKTHFFHSFVSWQFTVLPRHRDAGLWLHVTASEVVWSGVQHVIDLDSLKKHVLGWLMWQIWVTTEKYLAGDHKPSGFNIVKTSWHAKLCNGVVISPWYHAWCRIYSTGYHVCCHTAHSQHQPLMHTGIHCCGICGRTCIEQRRRVSASENFIWFAKLYRDMAFLPLTLYSCLLLLQCPSLSSVLPHSSFTIDDAGWLLGWLTGGLVALRLCCGRFVPTDRKVLMYVKCGLPALMKKLPEGLWCTVQLPGCYGLCHNIVLIWALM